MRRDAAADEKRKQTVLVQTAAHWESFVRDSIGGIAPKEGHENFAHKHIHNGGKFVRMKNVTYSVPTWFVHFLRGVESFGLDVVEAWIFEKEK